jgi:hypothetical protein
MSTIVLMPVRVKPAARRHGGDHLARLRILRQRHAAERRADDGVVDCRLLHRDLALRDLDLLLRRFDACDERIDFGFRVVDVVRRVQSFLAKPLLALQLHASLRQANFTFRDLPLRRFELRAIQLEGRLQRGVVEAGEDLALADGHAFLDVHFDHLAGDLR